MVFARGRGLSALPGRIRPARVAIRPITGGYAPHPFFVVTLTQNVDISSIKFTSTRYEGELLVHQIPPIMLANSIEFWRVHKNSANFFR